MTGVLDECDAVDETLADLRRRCGDRRNGCCYHGVRRKERTGAVIDVDHNVHVATARIFDTKPGRPN
jgi:hypothetical protein